MFEKNLKQMGWGGGDGLFCFFFFFLDVSISLSVCGRTLKFFLFITPFLNVIAICKNDTQQFALVIQGTIFHNFDGTPHPAEKNSQLTFWPIY